MMMRLTSAAIVACACLAFAGAAKAAPACKLIQIASLPIVMHGNQPIIEAEINGKPAHLMVDTGSFATMIFRSAAPSFGIASRTPNGGAVFGVGGGSDAMIADLGELKLDKTVAHNVRVIVAGESSQGEVSGLLGEDFLSQTDVEFDFAGGAMRLFQPKDCIGDQVVYWNKAYSVLPILPANSGRDIEVQVALSGHPVVATMDTGASTSVVTTWTAEQVGVTSQSAGVASAGSSVGVGREHVRTYVGTFPTFSFGDETIKNAKLRIADLFAADRAVRLGSHIPTKVLETPSMLLGADFFRSHRVYVARSQNKVYVSYQGGPVFDASHVADAASISAPPPPAIPSH